jgi:hypothetical protein
VESGSSLRPASFVGFDGLGRANAGDAQLFFLFFIKHYELTTVRFWSKLPIYYNLALFVGHSVLALILDGKLSLIKIL